MDIIVYLKSSVDFEIIALFIIMIVEIFYQPYAAYVMYAYCMLDWNIGLYSLANLRIGKTVGPVEKKSLWK